uniref:Uncharacterized protein n=1 Tax=Ditylenchus dipsaci TaxID=166011 RepID=A0A915D8F5_9BILA
MIKFAHKHNLFIFADEENVYAEGSKFYSFKKIISEMGEPYNHLELASFYSCSKGYMENVDCVVVMQSCSTWILSDGGV